MLTAGHIEIKLVEILSPRLADQRLPRIKVRPPRPDIAQIGIKSPYGETLRLNG
jgi:hypothetical protein